MKDNPTLEHIDGRKLTLNDGEVKIEAYLRKGVDGTQYLPLLQSAVYAVLVLEKGFYMVDKLEPLKPSLPKTQVAQERPSLPPTAVEKTKPVDMPSSANVPKLNFGRAESFTGVVGGGTETAKQTSVTPKFDIKQKLITASWAMGCVMNSHSLAQANDALALSTEQTMLRAKKLARELIDWAEEQSAK